jgi:hypothetical protein
VENEERQDATLEAADLSMGCAALAEAQPAAGEQVVMDARE